MDTRNGIKSYIVREGMTRADLVEKLAEQYGWSASVPNLSGKLRRDSLRYREAVELADALGYDIIWQRRREVRYQFQIHTAISGSAPESRTRIARSSLWARLASPASRFLWTSSPAKTLTAPNTSDCCGN